MPKTRRRRSGSKKIFGKYLFLITSISLITILILCTSSVFLALANWNKEQLQSLQQCSDILAANSERMLSSYYEKKEDRPEPGKDSGPPMEESAETFSLPAMICNDMRIMSESVSADIFITDPEGNLLVCKEMVDDRFNIDSDLRCELHSGIKIDEKSVAKAVNGELHEFSALNGSLPGERAVAGTPINSSGQTVAVIFATKPITESLQTYVLKILQIFLIASAFAIVIAFIVSYILSYKMTKPLRSMSEATRHYAEGDFSYKVRVRESSELYELAEAFNKMALSLSSLESSRRSFVANISHELKTPMTSIGGFIDGMLDGTIAPEEYSRYLTVVSDEVKRLSRLVTGMLNMSKLEAGQMPLNRTQFDFGNDIFKTLLTFEQKIDEKKIEIRGLESVSGVKIFADEDMILQIVFNLVDNAVKFTPEHGYIAFRCFRDAEKTYFSIRNSGKGIEKEEIAKIFERFYKVDKSRSYDVKGAGLGLFLVKSMIELHGGEIKASSVPDDYTEFSFFIPNI